MRGIFIVVHTGRKGKRQREAENGKERQLDAKKNRRCVERKQEAKKQRDREAGRWETDRQTEATRARGRESEKKLDIQRVSE